MKTTAERTRQLISEQIGAEISAITDDKHRVSDLGMDSLDDIELVMALEDEFFIEISDEDAEQCNTVGEIVALVQSKVKS